MIQEEKVVLAPLFCKPPVAQPNIEIAATLSKTQSLEDIGEWPKSEEGGIVDLEVVECGNGVSRMRLQYKYPEGQWSPINPRGKKQYDREFLLQLQYSILGQQKPAGMLYVPDIVFDKPHTKSHPEKIVQPDVKDFVPRFKWDIDQGGGAKKMKVKTISSPIEPAIPEHPDKLMLHTNNDFGLHKAKQPWKSRHLRIAKETDEETEELYKKTRSILNKLTPQKFQTLVSQMQALHIDSEDKLKGVIDLVFEWAVNMPLFSVPYANLCRCLSMFKVPSASKAGEMVNFRAVLLTRCQREFEKVCPSKKVLLAERRKEIEDVTKKGLSSKEDLEYETAKAKRRSLGNIRFMGELFKLKMMTENIMHDCVFKMLRTKDPENLEHLCRLMTTVGKELDVDKAKPRVDQYFAQMSKIIKDKKSKPRVKFMLMDLMDLRTNKWVPRRAENNPKTIDQIHKEVAQEAQEERALVSQQNQMAARSQGRGGGGGSRRGPPGQMGGSPDGWNTVASNRTPLRSVDRSIDPSKMKLSKQKVDEGAIKLGPGGGASRFAGWGRGSTRESTCRPSSELKLLSAEEMKKKTKAILDEYFTVQDMKEAILCVQELSAQNHHQFVLYAFNHVLERSSTARKQTGHVLHDLVKKKVISVDNYIKGLVEVLEFAEDLEIEIRKIWQYYGEMISPMIQDNSVPLSFLKQAAQPLIANNKAGVLLAEILHDASRREGHKKVAGLWTSSGLHWSDFVPKHQVEQFLKDKGLEFTNGGDTAPTTPTTGRAFNDIETKLNDLIVQKKADNEKVFDWIEGNVDEQTTKQPEFVHALMTAVCTNAIKGEKGKERLEPKEISNRNDLLQKYLDHQTETELQALYALQALITKLEHPQGILRGMFDTLYDEDIISEDAFFQWEKSEEEPEGKSSCLKQAVQFFTWLREAEDDS